MSNHRKTPREKPGNTTATNGRLPGGRKEKPPAKKELKRSIAADEGVGQREEASQVASPPRPRHAAAAVPAEPRRPALASAKPASPPKPTSSPKPVASKSSQAAPKPVSAPAKPVAEAARRAVAGPKPAPKADAQQHLPGGAVDTLERTFKAAGQGTLAVNCKLLDFARVNVISGLDHVKDLAAARSPVRVMRLQMEYWHDCLETFVSQTQELRALSAQLVSNANEPLREHIRGKGGAA